MMQLDKLFASQVTIAIPTYKIDGKILTILKLLERQTYKKFNVLIVYKVKGTKNSMEKLSNSKLDLTVINCMPNKIGPNFIEAMNVIFRKSDGDITINIDDDVRFGKTFIKEHLTQHQLHQEIGMATGSFTDKSDKTPRSVKMARYVLESQVDKPISPTFSNYEGYIGKSGMMLRTYKNADYMPTLSQRGLNMSWKREGLSGFKLPNYTIRTFRNEQAAALEAINRGYIPIKFSGARVIHLPVASSLTRSNDILHKKEFMAEKVLFAYYSSKFFDVDLKVLKARTMIDDLYTRITEDKRNDGYKIGYELTTRAINESWSEKKVKEHLMQIIIESKHPFGRYS